MSTLRVTAEKLIVHPHSNADALELAQVGEYRAVVRKGEFKSGDYALYIPEQALLPEWLLEEMGLTGRLKGSKHNRVGPVRLRGELSQGLVVIPELIKKLAAECEISVNEYLTLAGINEEDFAERLEITKWVPEVPSSLSGEVKAAPEIMRWIEIENIKRYPDIFEPGEMVSASEKVHGSCCLISVLKDDSNWLVSSKGFGSKSFAIIEDAKNLYWRALRANLNDELLQGLISELGASKLALFGEVYGAGVQDLTYGQERKDTPGYAVFDAKVVINGEERWLEQSELRSLLEGKIPTVPVLYEGPYDYATLVEVASGDSVVGEGANIREGVVVRAVPERRSEVLGGRAIGKVVSEAYLERHGGTEYE